MRKRETRTTLIPFAPMHMGRTQQYRILVLSRVTGASNCAARGNGKRVTRAQAGKQTHVVAVVVNNGSPLLATARSFVARVPFVIIIIIVKLRQ